jgi:hypothetical protein
MVSARRYEVGLGPWRELPSCLIDLHGSGFLLSAPCRFPARYQCIASRVCASYEDLSGTDQLAQYSVSAMTQVLSICFRRKAGIARIAHIDHSMSTSSLRKGPSPTLEHNLRA